MIRIGHAWDTHKLQEGRRLILGGVEINSKIGLLGHSDADVVLHAVAESLLGSLALGDLGTFFPDNSPKTLDMDSKVILRTCYNMVLEKGFEDTINNVNNVFNDMKVIAARKLVNISLDDYIDLIYDRLEMFDSKNIDKGIELGFSKVKK